MPPVKLLMFTNGLHVDFQKAYIVSSNKKSNIDKMKNKRRGLNFEMNDIFLTQ